MIRAVLFDMDGVLIDNEPLWNEYKENLFEELTGVREEGLGKKFVGMSLVSLHAHMVHHGATISLEAFNELFFTVAEKVYQEAPLAKNLDALVAVLRARGIRIAVVSASPLPWIHTVLRRTSFHDAVECVISLHEHQTLRGKPAPDGYQEAMKQLGVSKDEVVVVEDSNKGIASAKASGAYTVGYRANLIPGYVQEGADVYIDDLLELVNLIKEK